MIDTNPYATNLVEDRTPPKTGAAHVMLLGYLGTVLASIPGFLWLGSNQGTPIVSMGIGSVCTVITGAPIFIFWCWMFARVPLQKARWLAGVAGGLTGFVLFLVMLYLDYSTAIPLNTLKILVPPTIIGALGALVFARAPLPFPPDLNSDGRKT